MNRRRAFTHTHSSAPLSPDGRKVVQTISLETAERRVERIGLPMPVSREGNQIAPVTGVASSIEMATKFELFSCRVVVCRVS